MGITSVLVCTGKQQSFYIKNRFWIMAVTDSDEARIEICNLKQVDYRRLSHALLWWRWHEPQLFPSKWSRLRPGRYGWVTSLAAIRRSITPKFLKLSWTRPSKIRGLIEIGTVHSRCQRVSRSLAESQFSIWKEIRGQHTTLTYNLDKKLEHFFLLLFLPS